MCGKWRAQSKEARCQTGWDWQLLTEIKGAHGGEGEYKMLAWKNGNQNKSGRERDRQGQVPKDVLSIKMDQSGCEAWKEKMRELNSVIGYCLSDLSRRKLWLSLK